MYKIIGVDGQIYGPVTAEQMRQWITEGRANTNTKVQPEGATEWKTLAEYPEFAPFLGNRAALPGPGTPVNPDALVEETLAGGVDLSIGDCISRGWELVKADFWPTVGCCALAYIIIASVGIIAGPVLGGMYFYFLKRLRGQTPTLNDVFAGFTTGFLPLFLCYLVENILIMVGVFLCLIPGIYLAVAWAFAIPLVMDKKLDFWPAMEVSRRVVNKIWWSVFGLVLVEMLLMFLGVLCCLVGVFVAFPVIVAATACAYESIFNRAKNSA